MSSIIVVDKATLRVQCMLSGREPDIEQAWKSDFPEDKYEHIILGKVYTDIRGFQISKDATGAIIVAWTNSYMWADIRRERDARLAACDWTQFPDVNLSPEKQTAWNAYRQALRDLPANTPDPENVTWPVPPN
jgi:hypothetical protein